MNKNFKVITINGVRGIFAAVFIVLGLIAGFIISPGYVCMKLWNFTFQDSVSMVSMNLLQGIMLWAIIALILYALNNKKSLIGFGAYQGLSPEQVKEAMMRAKEEENKIFKDFENRIKQLHAENKQELPVENAEVSSSENGTKPEENCEEIGR